VINAVSTAQVAAKSTTDENYAVQNIEVTSPAAEIRVTRCDNSSNRRNLESSHSKTCKFRYHA